MSSHMNIARLFGCCMELEGPALVYEYSGDEPLNNFLYDRDTASSGPQEDRSLKWESRLRIAKDIANAVVYLHTALSGPIVNRDLKPSNIMVDQHGVAKLFDFSFSISIPPGESRVEDKPFGAVWFMDPDYIQSGFITDKSDVFSFGMILLTLLTGQSLFSNNLKEAEEEGDLVAYVKKYVDKNQITEILDPIILEGGGIEQEKQFRDFLELALRCVQEKGEDRPEMIYVAKELT
uniref:Protein kinase domain-containing protein n=1 Tax=Davidia involucrata TaxID=16924 RepID=A0A5B6Z5S7_DAVIN